MDNKQVINTLEEFKNICLKKNCFSGHYNPEKFLKKYIYSVNILLDVFYTDYMIWCYEDYYYNDFCLSMISQYQPHINIDEFIILTQDLDSVLELLKRSKLVLELFYNSKSIQTISRWKYEIIEDYCDYLIKINDENDENDENNENYNNTIIIDYVNLLMTNKCCIVKKFYSLNEKIVSKEDVITKAKQIINILSNIEYSSILPLE